MRIKVNNFTHYNMAVAGGVFGGFAVCNLGEIFGNAQTLNLIGIVYNLVYCNFETLLLRIIAALLYFLGFAAAVISIVVDILAFITLMFLPKNADFLISLYPIFFAMAFQWTAFEYIEGYSCSTIFSSNNYRQFTTSLVEYAIDKDKSRLTKTRVFGLTLLYFHIGVALACISAIHFGRLSAFIGILVLLPTIYLLIKKRIIRLKNIKTQTNDAKRDT